MHTRVCCNGMNYTAQIWYRNSHGQRIWQANQLYSEWKQSSKTAIDKTQETSWSTQIQQCSVRRFDACRIQYFNPTPFRPMYSEIWPLAIAPTIAPTFDKEPNRENWAGIYVSHHCSTIQQESCYSKKKTYPYLRYSKPKITHNGGLGRWWITRLSLKRNQSIPKQDTLMKKGKLISHIFWAWESKLREYHKSQTTPLNSCNWGQVSHLKTKPRSFTFRAPKLSDLARTN